VRNQRVGKGGSGAATLDWYQELDIQGGSGGMKKDTDLDCRTNAKNIGEYTHNIGTKGSTKAEQGSMLEGSIDYLEGSSVGK